MMPDEWRSGDVAALKTVNIMNGGFDANTCSLLAKGGTVLLFFTVSLPSDSVLGTVAEVLPGEFPLCLCLFWTPKNPFSLWYCNTDETNVSGYNLMVSEE